MSGTGNTTRAPTRTISQVQPDQPITDKSGRMTFSFSQFLVRLSGYVGPVPTGAGGSGTSLSLTETVSNVSNQMQTISGQAGVDGATLGRIGALEQARAVMPPLPQAPAARPVLAPLAPVPAPHAPLVPLPPVPLPQLWRAAEVDSVGAGLTISGGALIATGTGGGSAPTFAGGLTAAGTTQATAYQLTTQNAQFSTVASGTGAILTANAVGIGQTIINDGVNLLLVYPVSGQNFTGLAANIPVQIPPGGSATFWQVTSTQVSVR